MRMGLLNSGLPVGLNRLRDPFSERRVLSPLPGGQGVLQRDRALHVIRIGRDHGGLLFVAQFFGIHLDFSQYVGPCPVSLAAYLAQMRSLAAARGYIDRERLRQGFSHLIISDQVLDQLGPAVNAG